MCYAMQVIKQEERIRGICETCHEVELTFEETVSKITQKFEISREKAEEYVKTYYK